MTPQNIAGLMRERAALRGLADSAIKARGELGTNDSPVARYIETVAFGIAERWAAVDREARRAIRASDGINLHAQLRLRGRVGLTTTHTR